MSKKLLITGIILAIVAVVLINMRINQVESSQKRYAFLQLDAAETLAAGDTIALDRLRIVYLPEDFNSLSQTAVLDSEESRTWLSGRKVTSDVAGGSFLLYEHFADKPDTRFASQIDESNRAMTIPVNAMSSVGFFIEPGSTVDVLGTVEEQIPVDIGAAEDNPETVRVVTKTILQNILVLAVGDATTRGNYMRKDERGYTTVTLEVTPLQAEVLVFATQHVLGGLTLVLRNPANNDVSEIPNVSWEQLRTD